jgi:CheY-like chemotaxis protein/anti-sigma regulatory factor (Ser/Thr protein kinase)
MTALHPVSTECRAGQPPRLDFAGPITALVVDDSALDRRLVGGLLENGLGLRTLDATNGREALEVLERETPGVVLTDLQMQEMDGLQLVQAMRDRHPLVPVILVTAYGNEDVAVQALRKGAASYVPKRNLARDLVDTVEKVLAAARVDRRRQRLLDSLAEADYHFVLENDPAIIPVLVSHFQEHLLRLRLCDHPGRTRIGIALEEALLNALYHGNLEISSELRQGDDSAFYELAVQRCAMAPYADRRLHVHVRLSREAGTFVVRDEGPGFDPAALPDPTAPENFGKLSGRGLLLIRTFMDEVCFNAAGNEITMVKRAEGSAEAACAS